MINRKILSVGESVMLVRVELAKGFKGDIDQHPEEQISYIEKGKVEFEVDGITRILSQGDVQHISPHMIHRVNVLEDCVILDVFTPLRRELLEKN
jgi:quercetin dioxygenase-like cupin family protein